MAFFSNLKNTASSIGGAAKNTLNTGMTDAKDSSELAELKRELSTIEADITSGYAQVGKKYVDYIKRTSDMGGVDVTSELNMLGPKFERKEELMAMMVEIEKRMKDRTLLQEKSKVEAEVQVEIDKLDKAKAMDLVSQDEYDLKVSRLRKRVDNFEAIKKAEQKCEMGITTPAERDAEIAALLS